MTVASATAPLVMVYDLSAPGAWDMACQHARWWGRLYTTVDHLFADRVALTFHPASDERWRGWERVRAAWILEDLEKKAA